jgi:dihydroflavonol-4-reductase
MILVTGAAGHVGNVLVRELLVRGECVRVLILPGEDCTSLEGLDVEKVDGDVLKPASLENAMQGVDLVYHLAAIISIVPRKDDLVRRVNVQGTRNVIQAARKAGVRRVVYTSSIHALTRPPHGVKVNEDLSFDADNPVGEYDRSKAEASLEILKAVDEGLDAVIVCPTGIIGPYDFRLSEMGHLVLDWMKNKLHVLVKGFYDFVDVRDVAKGHILAAEKGRKGQTYILGGERIGLIDLKKLVQKAMGIRSPQVFIPIPIAKFFAQFTPMFYRLTHTQPRFTPYSIETICSNSDISHEKAERELGYQPRSLHQAIEDTVIWWRAIIRQSLPKGIKHRR